MIAKLSAAELEQALASLEHWSYDSARLALHRHIQTRDFCEAFGLMTRVALAAERRDHHPEWSNVYNSIDIWLTTHDAGGVSHQDVELAQYIDAAFAEL